MCLHNCLKLSFALLLSVFSLPAPAICFSVCTLNVAKVAGSDLRYGSMVVIAGGSVTVSPSTGLRSGSAIVFTPASVANSVGPAEFTVSCSGSGSIRYTVTLLTPTSVSTASTSMALTDFVTSPPISNERIVLDCSTYQEVIKVGATLTLDGAQSAGNYTSTNGIWLSVTKTL